MKQFAWIFMLCATASASFAGNLEEGLKAHEQKHYAVAMRAFEKAVQTGNSEASRRLGFMYYHGEGVAQDSKKAVALFERAAMGGDARSAANLGTMYEYGMGVEQDDIRAAAWYRSAGELGDPQSQLVTSITLYQGKGVAKDRVEAAKWWTIAMKNGPTWEARFRPTIESAEAKLTIDELTEGRRRASEWIAARVAK